MNKKVRTCVSLGLIAFTLIYVRTVTLKALHEVAVSVGDTR